MSISNTIDFNPHLNAEKQRVFSSIKNGNFKDNYIPVIRIINKSTKIYNLTHIKFKTQTNWKFIQLESNKYIIREFLKEEKYFPSQSIASKYSLIDSPVILEPGEKMFLIPNNILALDSILYNGNESIIVQLFNGKEMLKFTKFKKVNPIISDLLLTDKILNSDEFLRIMLLDNLEFNNYKKLLMNITTKLDSIKP